MLTSIIVATYGTERWRELADERAVPSAVREQPHELIRIHEPNGRVATARNAGAAQATGDWLVFLDGDDELSPNYLGAMRQALEQEGTDGNQTLLLAPAVSYVRGRHRERPKFWPECSLQDGNWLVIGTAVPRELFLQVGGFDDRPDYGAFEDYALWIKCWKAGGQPRKVPKAIYLAHITADSRHRGATRHERLGWHYAIGKDHFPEAYTERWLHHHHAIDARTRRTERARTRVRPR